MFQQKLVKIVTLWILCCSAYARASSVTTELFISRTVGVERIREAEIPLVTVCVCNLMFLTYLLIKIASCIEIHVFSFAEFLTCIDHVIFIKVSMIIPIELSLKGITTDIWE